MAAGIGSSGGDEASVLVMLAEIAARMTIQEVLRAVRKVLEAEQFIMCLKLGVHWTPPAVPRSPSFIAGVSRLPHALHVLWQVPLMSEGGC